MERSKFSEFIFHSEFVFDYFIAFKKNLPTINRCNIIKSANGQTKGKLSKRGLFYKLMRFKKW